MTELYPWQEDLLKKLNGVKPGEMNIMMAGRNVGKSQFSAGALKRLMDDMLNRPVENLILSEGTVYGSRYHTVEPVGGNWAQMEIWCYDTFGEANSSIWAESPAPEPAERWYMNNRKFWFRNESDRTMFILRWR
jgi:hypothetical protein